MLNKFNKLIASVKTKKSKYIIVGITAAAVICLYWLIGFGTINLERYDRVSVIDEQLVVSREVSVYTMASGFLMPIILLAVPLSLLLFVKLYKEFGIKLIKFNMSRKLFLPLYFIIIFGLTTLSNWGIGFMGAMSTLFSIRIAAALIIVLYTAISLRKEKARIEYLNFLAVLYILTGLLQASNNLAKTFHDINIVVGFEDTSWFFRSLIQEFNIDIMPLYYSMLFAAVIYISSLGSKYLFKFRKKK